MGNNVLDIKNHLERGKRDQERLENAIRRALCKVDSALDIFYGGDHKSGTASQVVKELEQTRSRLLATLQKTVKRPCI
jgi:hypothetical protein